MIRRSLLVAAFAALPMLTAAPADAASSVPASIAVKRAVPRISAKEVPLEKVINHLREMSGTNLIVNWKALEAAGVFKETPVTIELSDLALGKLLNAVLDSVTTNAPLTHYVDGNFIRVTSVADADEQLITMMYSIGEFLAPKARNLPGPTSPNILAGIGGLGGFGGGVNGLGGLGGISGIGPQVIGPGIGGIGGIGGVGGIGTQTGVGGTNNNNGSNNDATARRDAVNQTIENNGKAFMEMIAATIRPDVWVENGGKSTMRIWQTTLIVRAPRSVQEQIGGPVSENRRFGF